MLVLTLCMRVCACVCVFVIVVSSFLPSPSSAEMQGYRTNMEDAHVVNLGLPSHPSITYVGMFDGHNGPAAAEWMAKHTPNRLGVLTNPTDHKQLAEAVEQADADFMSDASVRVHGATACLALITTSPNGSRKLTVANVGDSRCLVIGSKDGSIKFTTVDHKPETRSEAERIRAAGGSVSLGRVDGDLAMSRSIGDYSYKNVPHLNQIEQKVIPTPDCNDIELETNDIVLVCCDGLVERLSNEQLGKFIVEQLSKLESPNLADPAMIVAGLIDYSLASGSKDNMSAALILPLDGSSYARADEYRCGPYTEWSTDRSFVDAYFTDARKHGYTNEQLLEMVKKQRGGGTA